MLRTQLTQRFVGLVALLAVVAACADQPTAPLSPRAPAPSLAAEDGSIPGHYVVVAGWDYDAAVLAREYGLAPKYVYSELLNGFAAAIPDDVAAALAADPRVLNIAVQRQVTTNEMVTQTGATWGLDRIDQRALPLDGLYTYDDKAGHGVTSYIIDTGIRFSHRDFGGRASPGFDAFANDPSDALLDPGTGDCQGHGTHVAGTVGGATYGVAKRVKLVSVRVLNCVGFGSDADVIAGMDWVAKNATLPATANMSLGDPVPTKAAGVSFIVDDVLRALIASGVSVSVAAGNGWTGVGLVGADACLFPFSNVPEAITVAASTITDTRTRWTNNGPCIDVFAPGSLVLSATFDSDSSAGTKSGTSMATPHVAGVASLILAHAPGASPADVQNLINTQATQGIIRTVTGNDAYTPNSNLLYSHVEIPSSLRGKKLLHDKPCTPRRQLNGDC